MTELLPNALAVPVPSMSFGYDINNYSSKGLDPERNILILKKEQL